MDDIMERLRHPEVLEHWGVEMFLLAINAADEIERLRAAGDALIAAIRNHDLREQHIKAWKEARRG